MAKIMTFLGEFRRIGSMLKILQRDIQSYWVERTLSHGRALPDRRNIILTRDKYFNFDGCEIVHSIKDVFELCKNEQEIFIFGGEQIYNIFLPFVKKMYITKIHYELKGDTFFPEVNFDEWKEVSVEKGVMNDKNPYNYYFHVYERKLS
ncbi:dihydrofolate reductase (trimethoprim resistance protein) [Neobacillus niacini]|nr:dihydrofolate reductase (trimethoprim resistance protein) [Neobacillus niacini]